jgi:hypothetical protein
VCGPDAAPARIEDLGVRSSGGWRRRSSGRRAQHPAPAARENEERLRALLREYNRVFGSEPGAPGSSCARHSDSAPRPDESRRGDRFSGRGWAQLGILQQVTNGVAVRMAVLYLLAGGVPGDRGSSGSSARQGECDEPILIRGGRVVDPSQKLDRCSTCCSRTARCRELGEGLRSGRRRGDRGRRPHRVVRA